MIELRRRYSGGVQSPSFSRLPKEYQEVEYLEDTGIQYIALPVRKGFKGTIEANIEFVNTYTNDNLVPYRCAVVWNNGPQIGCEVSGGKLLWENYNTSNKEAELNKRYNTKLEVNGDSSFLFVDDQLVISNTAFNRDVELGLFNAVYVLTTAFFGRIYYVKISGSSNLELVPCYRTSDHKPGMYDIVNDVFYTNVGTGEFLYGPDVHYNIPPEYQQVEYLETQGDGAYIKTNVPYDSTQDDYVLTCKYLILSHSRFAHIFGVSEGDSYSSIVLAQNAASNSYLAFFNKACTSQHYVISTTNGFGNATTCIMRMLQMTISDELFIPIREGADGIVSMNKTEFCLFKANQNNNTSLFMRAYEFVIEKGSNVLCRLIPCYRKADNVAGMYDLVNGVFYTNAGTGSFIVGPDIIG